jgi:hypothetical protein
MIANVDTLDMPGSHWVAIYATPKTVYIYDSFGPNCRSTTYENKLNTKKNKISYLTQTIDQNSLEKPLKYADLILLNLRFCSLSRFWYS